MYLSQTCSQILIILRGLDKYSHNYCLYLQEGVFVAGIIFLHGHRSINYSLRDSVVRHHQNITSIPPAEESTSSVAHDFYFRSYNITQVMANCHLQLTKNISDFTYKMSIGDFLFLYLFNTVFAIVLHPCDCPDSHPESLQQHNSYSCLNINISDPTNLLSLTFSFQWTKVDCLGPSRS